MRWTKFLIPTTKEVPKDAVVPSHQLMLRAGLIRQLAAGVYSYLPLGYRTLRKIEAIVREEMDRAGAIELHMPVLHPKELWQQTGRTAAMGDVLLGLRPVKDGDESDWRAQTVLGPTHEEPVTEIARAYLNSYKMLPVNLYQIQVKFRGEARPKSGVLRTREFLMKDAYSFHRDKESLDEGYQRMYDAYCRIFTRCGLPYIACEAESGPIGGDASHEFMVLTEAGEDVVALTENGDYAANTERAVCAPLPANEPRAGNEPRAIHEPRASARAASDDELLPMQDVHTPNQRTIDEVCAFLNVPASRMIKTLIYVETLKHENAKTPKQGPPMPCVVLVRGDHEVNENKLNRIAGAKLELADDKTITSLTGAAVGFAGPHTLGKTGVPYRLIVDQAVSVMRNAATGANKTDYHTINVNPGRDFPLQGENVVVADVRNVVDGDLSPTGSGSPIRLKKAIEIGHVFKLGTKYSDAMKATFLDNDGKPKSLIMGCYGIGLNRIMAAAIEAHHDENGIIWPASIAPFSVLIVALDPREADVMNTAQTLHDELEAAGVDVLFDDRDERAGFKFKDADLIGIPVRITVGRKSLAEGVVELKRRDSTEVEKIPPAEAASRAKAAISQV
ncbi:MAG: proline--tRNA ligase [Phycisphaerae bacterium]|nr:MAG: proline--tRNA ligase [Planctomycetia bacterium]RIK66849.1 MAG: proline--tRNA ligase [Planctomycetota bacterium]GJQ26989.1 MAG: proline--tRNA ligase [Phycisphaerae bacterium]